jgi:hypothetical protein
MHFMTIHNCTLFGSPRAGIPGLSPPQLLIFFQIPKTGGTTMKAILAHCLQDQHFDMGFDEEPPDTALWVYSTARIAKKFHQLPIERQRAVRCVMGEHVTYDINTIIDRPSKFFTILRHPVDRVISQFFYSRTLSYCRATDSSGI